MGLLGGTAATNVPIPSTVNTSAPVSGDGSVGSPVTIAALALTGASIANSTITNGKLAAGAVATSSPVSGDGTAGSPVTIANGTITNAKLAAGAVATASGVGGDGTSTLPVILAFTRATFAGAGPHAVSATLVSRILVTPGAGAVAVTNLPSLANAAVIDGWTFEVCNTGTGADMVLLIPDGTDTIDGATFYRAFQKGSVILVADKTSGTWLVAGEKQGFPTTISISVTSAGNDANPGTAALPVLTIARAFERLDVQWTASAVGSADVVVTGAYTDSNSRTIAVPGPKPGSGGAAPRLVGPAQVDAGFGVITVTGGSASNTANFRQVTFAAVAGLANDGGADFFFRGLSGAVNGRRQPVQLSTSTTIQWIENGAALTTGTFQVEVPNATLSNHSFGPGTGNRLTIVDFDLNTCTFTELVVTSTFCRMDVVVQLNGNHTHTSLMLPLSGSGQGYSATGGNLTLSNLGFRNVVTTVGTNISVPLAGVDDTPSLGVLSSLSVSGGQLTSLNVKMLECQTFGVTLLNTVSDIGTSNFDSPTNSVGTAIFVSGGSARLSDVTGDTGAATGFAVQAANGAIVQTNAGTTINANGAANAVEVGANGTKSWATIAGDLSIDVFDGGAVSGASGVSVRQTL